MKRGIIAAGVLLAAGAAGHAADLSTASELQAPAAPIMGWNGFYLGLHSGLAGDQFTYPVNYSGPPEIDASVSLNSSGFFGGAQAGYNFQPASNWLLGIEADISAADIEGMLNASASIPSGPLTLSGSAGSKVDWFGTLRGRVGMVYGPLMVYGTGGLAYGQTTASYNLAATGLLTGSLSGSKSDTNLGWTVGAGVEYAVTPNISLKTEYKYVDLGSANLLSASLGGGTLTIDQDTHFHSIEVGFNYRFDGQGASSFPTPVPVNWNGLYVGLNGGFGGDEFAYPVAYSGPPEIGANVSLNSSGFFGGAQAGYNFQSGSNWLLGVETDISAADIEGMLDASVSIPSGPLTLSGSAGSKVDWFGTVRGRVGMGYGPLMLYGTGGLAYGQTTASYNLAATGLLTGSLSGSKSDTNLGWTVGAGAEYAITPNISLKTEYKYVDLGSANLLSASLGGGTLSIDQDTHFHTIDVGVNYRF